MLHPNLRHSWTYLKHYWTATSPLERSRALFPKPVSRMAFQQLNHWPDLYQFSKQGPSKPVHQLRWAFKKHVTESNVSAVAIFRGYKKCHRASSLPPGFPCQCTGCLLLRPHVTQVPRGPPSTHIPACHVQNSSCLNPWPANTKQQCKSQQE